MELHPEHLAALATPGYGRGQVELGKFTKSEIHSWPRFSFCATPLNETALMVLGGWGVDGALDSVQVLVSQLKMMMMVMRLIKVIIVMAGMMLIVMVAVMIT